jgi:hypothetical protein
MIAKQFEPMALGKNRPQNVPAGFPTVPRNALAGGALDMRYCLCVRSGAAIVQWRPFFYWRWTITPGTLL